ncbi:hypothetical protein [Bradyrhizobium sp. B117]|uniref:hypothetical protein n=1 Tax=Bradyrhizobium sp. B117 TaxID=3140246 RepID=UPI0031843788
MLSNEETKTEKTCDDLSDPNARVAATQRTDADDKKSPNPSVLRAVPVRSKARVNRTSGGAALIKNGTARPNGKFTRNNHGHFATASIAAAMVGPNAPGIATANATSARPLLTMPRG